MPYGQQIWGPMAFNCCPAIWRKKRRDHNTPERLAQLAKAREKALAKRRENSKRRKQEKEEALRKKYAPPAPPKATPKKPSITKRWNPLRSLSKPRQRLPKNHPRALNSFIANTS